ncbi:hypothetical protein ACVIGB_004785 [Bradyrhizobium sp. USDA 4341]
MEAIDRRKVMNGRGSIAFSVWQIRDSKPIARLSTHFEIVLDCHDSQVWFNATGFEVGEGY